MRSWSVPAVLGVRRSGSLNFFAAHVHNYKHTRNSLIYSTLNYMYSHNNYSHNYSSIHTQNYIFNRHPSPFVAVGRARRVACEQ